MLYHTIIYLHMFMMRIKESLLKHIGRYDFINKNQESHLIVLGRIAKTSLYGYKMVDRCQCCPLLFRWTDAAAPWWFPLPWESAREAPPRDASQGRLLRLPAQRSRKDVSESKVHQQAGPQEAGRQTHAEGLAGEARETPGPQTSQSEGRVATEELLPNKFRKLFLIILYQLRIIIITVVCNYNNIQ